MPMLDAEVVAIKMKDMGAIVQQANLTRILSTLSIV